MRSVMLVIDRGHECTRICLSRQSLGRCDRSRSVSDNCLEYAIVVLFAVDYLLKLCGGWLCACDCCQKWIVYKVEGIYNYFDPDYTFFYCSLGLGYIIDDVFLNKLIYGYFVYLSYFAVVDDYYAVGFLNSEAAAAPNKNSGF